MVKEPFGSCERGVGLRGDGTLQPDTRILSRLALPGENHFELAGADFRAVRRGLPRFFKEFLRLSQVGRETRNARWSHRICISAAAVLPTRLQLQRTKNGVASPIRQFRV